MEMELVNRLHSLLSSRKVAALGTLHHGAPYVSMVPVAVLPDGTAFIIHVSGLAAHTRDMLLDPRVSLLVTDSEDDGKSPQALARFTVLGQAHQLSTEDELYVSAREAYLSRFPGSAQMFELGDFSLFVIAPSSVRLVAGFGQAVSLTPEAFAAAAKARS